MVQARIRPVLWGILLLAAALQPLTATAQSRTSPQRRAKLQLLLKERADRHAQFVKKVNDLAREREEQNDSTSAAEIRRYALPVDHEQLRSRVWPANVQVPLSEDLPTEERSWRVRLNSLRTEHAKEVFSLARNAARDDHPSLAFDLIRETLEFDSDHLAARKVLGYQKLDQQWLTNYAAKMRRKRFTWSDDFGWLPSEQIARYESGQRLCDGRWMSADEETAKRRDFRRNPWEIRTDHFLVRTNHTLEDGVRLARELEDYYRVFFGIFGAFFIPQDQLRQLDGNSSGADSGHVFKIHFYHTRDEYNRELKGKIPQNIEVTTGLYLTDPHTSYTFHDPTGEVDVRTTLIHEATHQMFTESRPARTPIAMRANFWLVEGIACYMESYRRDADRVVVGDPHYIRFKNARYRRLESNYYVPLDQFTAMGMQQFQNSEKLAMNYSQAAGLTHFFMHYADGLYRDALCEQISEIYSQNDRIRQNPRTLQDLIGVSYAELDKQYLEYIQAQEREFSQLGIAPTPEAVTPAASIESSE